MSPERILRHGDFPHVTEKNVIQTLTEYFRDSAVFPTLTRRRMEEKDPEIIKGIQEGLLALGELAGQGGAFLVGSALVWRALDLELPILTPYTQNPLFRVVGLEDFVNMRRSENPELIAGVVGLMAESRSTDEATALLTGATLMYELKRDAAGRTSNRPQ